MKFAFPNRLLPFAVLLSFVAPSATLAAKPGVELKVLGTYDGGGYNAGAAEIVAHDPLTQRLFVVNAEDTSIDIIDVSNPSAPTAAFGVSAIDISPYGGQANSVDVCNGIVAAAVQADVKTDDGTVEFFDTDGNHLKSVPAGALPDMVTFTPNCEKVLAANEGEPNNYNQTNSVDPEGSITIVDLANGVANAVTRQIGFTAFNGTTLDASVRIFGPNATIAQDLEPEYIAVDHNSTTAWITLQENNAIAILDLKSETITDIVGLGYKDHSLPENKLDASDRDNAINIANWPVFGMYQPDGIVSYKYKNDTFLVTANEGDARDYPAPVPSPSATPFPPSLVEEIRVGSGTYLLDSGVFPNFAELKANARLGRLTVTQATGNTDADAAFERIYAFGTRSFSIHTSSGRRIYDSGDEIEQIVKIQYPDNFNANHSCDLPCVATSGNEPDNRSDNKGPEPEGVTVGKAYGRTYAFIGLERMGGIMVYDVTNPYNPSFVQYINNRDFDVRTNLPGAGDLGPEGVHFISEDDSPTGVPLIAVANEVSGTTTLYELVQVK